MTYSTIIWHGHGSPQRLRAQAGRGRPKRSLVCDDAGARARCARRVPQQRGPLSNAELAEHTGLSRPTVSRLTYTLAQLGYLKRDAKGRFVLGLGVLAAAYPVLSALKVRQLARPLMRDFAAYAGGTVSIAMPFGLDFIYVETLRTTDAVPHVPDVGFTERWRPPRSAARCCRSAPRTSSTLMCRP